MKKVSKFITEDLNNFLQNKSNFYVSFIGLTVVIGVVLNLLGV